MATYVLNDEKMFSDVADGIAIVINSETGIYYGMNGFGTVVFENLLNGVPTEAILAEVKTSSAAPADMEQRLNAFIKALEEFEIIVPGDTPAGTPDLDLMVGQADDFDLKVEEFSDAQELLLADPIHEVKNDTGWQPNKNALETDANVVEQKLSKKNV